MNYLDSGQSSNSLPSYIHYVVYGQSRFASSYAVTWDIDVSVSYNLTVGLLLALIRGQKPTEGVRRLRLEFRVSNKY